MSDTVSAVQIRRDADRRLPYLHLGLRCDAPFARSYRFALRGLDAVVLGRGDGHDRADQGGLDTLTIRVPDPRMSTIHARLTRLGEAWVVEDCASKNGVFVDGAAASRTSLADGAVIEVGQTFFVLAFDAELAPDGAATETAPGLSTQLPSLAASYQRLARAATSSVPVVVRGETGSGKELIAQAVHAASGRRGRLVAVNCGGIPSTLIEAELFGHRRGAFSGATDDRAGVIRSAHGGTLFLDEIAELPASAQAALLRVLQEGEVTPLGADRPEPVDARIVSATHQDLERLVDAGKFRADLLARLAGLTLEAPPLRDRRADLASIVATLLARLDAPAQLRFSLAAGRRLYRHTWPRNVRELERALAGALATLAGDELDAADLPSLPRAPWPGVAPVLKLSAEDAALRDRLVASLARHDGNLAAVARELERDRKQIRRWMLRFGLERPE